MSQNDVGIYASQISGHLWAPVGAYDALATVTLASTTSTVTFSGIPSGYKHLQIRCAVRSDRAVALDSYFIYINADSTAGTNYRGHGIYGDGASISAYDDGGNFMPVGIIPGTSATSLIFGSHIVDLPDYAVSNKNKTSRSLGGADLNGSGQARFVSGSWNSTAPITSLTFTTNGGGSFIAGSTFALYGVK